MENKIIPKKIESLTSIRFFLALIVLFSHIDEFFPQYNILPSLIGRYAVTSFFILSGMILTHVYFKINFLVKRNVIKFYQKRFSRIYPLYVLPLIMLIPLKLLMQYISLDSVSNTESLYIKEFTWVNFMIQLFSIQSFTIGFSQSSFSWNNPGWSVSNEMFFYLTFPLFIILFNKFTKKQLVYALIIVFVFSSINSFIISQYLHITKAPAIIQILYMNPLIRLSEFILGIICYNIYLKINFKNILTYFFIVGVIINILIIGFAFQYMSLAIIYNILIILSYCLIVNPQFMRSKFFVLLGNSSYSLYLLHGPLLLYIFLICKLHHVYITPVSLVIILIFIVLISILTYLFYEKPINLFLRKKWKL